MRPGKRLSTPSITSGQGVTPSVSVGRALRAAVVFVAASLAVSAASADETKLAVMLTAPVNGAVYLAPATIPLAATVTVLREKDDDRDKGKDKEKEKQKKKEKEKDKPKSGDKDQDKKGDKDKDEDKKNDQDEHGSPHERVVKVDFLQGATVIGTATAAPYAFNWINVPAGNYVLTARATNAKGETVSSAPVGIIVNAPPTVAITTPTNNTVVTAPASITLTAAAADSDGSIAKVDFFQGATLIGTATGAPYSISWTNVAAGSYSLSAVATDNRGASTTSAAVAIRVNAVPTVSLTSPADSATFTAPADIPLAANAADSDGTIAKVEFYHGSTLITTLTAAPFSVIWTGVPQGSYTLTAKVTDNQGAESTSTAVTVTVNAAVASTLYYIHTDHLNTPRVITNQAAQVVWRWDNTDPFGGSPPDENPSGLGNFTCNLRLPGQYFDRETNTHYNYFRDYDPSIGRYIQSDPIGLAGGINTYAYVEGNPLSKTDPDGLASLITNMGAGTTTFDPRPEDPSGQPITIQTRNAVDPRARPGANDPFNTPNIAGCINVTAPAFGQNAYIRVRDRRGRDIHGGGSSLPDPFASRQGWRPTMGCTRGQNEDIQALCQEINSFQQRFPDVPIPYSRAR